MKDLLQWMLVFLRRSIACGDQWSIKPCCMYIKVKFMEIALSDSKFFYHCSFFLEVFPGKKHQGTRMESCEYSR